MMIMKTGAKIWRILNLERQSGVWYVCFVISRCSLGSVWLILNQERQFGVGYDDFIIKRGSLLVWYGSFLIEWGSLGYGMAIPSSKGAVWSQIRLFPREKRQSEGLIRLFPHQLRQSGVQFGYFIVKGQVWGYGIVISSSRSGAVRGLIWLFPDREADRGHSMVICSSREAVWGPDGYCSMEKDSLVAE